MKRDLKFKEYVVLSGCLRDTKVFWVVARLLLKYYGRFLFSHQRVLGGCKRLKSLFVSTFERLISIKQLLLQSDSDRALGFRHQTRPWCRFQTVWPVLCTSCRSRRCVWYRRTREPALCPQLTMWMTSLTGYTRSSCWGDRAVPCSWRSAEINI